MDFRVGLVVFLCLLGLANGTRFHDCQSAKFHASSVVVEGCPDTEEGPCKLIKGRNYTISVLFKSGLESQSSKAVVHGIIAGVPVPFNLDNSDGCKSGITCPIHKDQQYIYKTTLPVKTVYPSIRLTVEWELRDDTKQDLFCIEFPVQID